MNQIKINELIKEKNISVPLYLLRNLSTYNLNKDEIILLIYLYNKDKNIFNPEIISKDLNMEILDIMTIISNLSDLGLVEIKTCKDDKGVIEEIINLDGLFDKLTLELMKNLNSSDTNDNNIHEVIEKEFNRRLTPMEHELVDDWLINDYDKNLIMEAIKEASLNGVTKLRYIDKILFDWNKNGIKNTEDLKNRENIEESDNEEELDTNYDDWLDYDEDEI